MPTDAEGADPAVSAADVFDLLGEALRVHIVAALYDADCTPSAGNELEFSALYERVGAEDSGRFNYHLQRLRGRLVVKGDAGYRLTPLGARLARLSRETLDRSDVGSVPV